MINVLGIDKRSADAVRLLKYRQLKSNDFASLASSIIEARVSGQDEATIHDVNSSLDSIAEGYNNKCLSSDTILKMYHPDASQLYDVTLSLKLVCERLPNLNASVDTVELTLFKPFRPMLACSVLPDIVPEVMKGAEFYVETKFDGERVQMHRDVDTYKYFSRNGGEFSSTYGETPLQGSLTQYLQNAFSASVKNCILDGEMIGWNRIDKCFATKGDHVDVKCLRSGDTINPCYVIFDLLYLNDTQLTSLPLHERLNRLRKVVREVEDYLVIAEQKTEVINALTDAVGRREEGIIVKNPQSLYRSDCPCRLSNCGYFLM
ncbi:DNA ligase A M domain containing protein [Trichuris trichiura]|uniref:DNA ligase A M domain containing protein n=1 Tax=Trichuris trichiura TaxID=36087 RepID=A0A077Z7L2_TRITR|nr:DNA ligase A M domain containing protein [Trichuris trichiura]